MGIYSTKDQKIKKNDPWMDGSWFNRSLNWFSMVRDLPKIQIMDLIIKIHPLIECCPINHFRSKVITKCYILDISKVNSSKCFKLLNNLNIMCINEIFAVKYYEICHLLSIQITLEMYYKHPQGIINHLPQGILIHPQWLGSPSHGANVNKIINCVKVMMFGAMIFVMGRS